MLMMLAGNLLVQRLPGLGGKLQTCQTKRVFDAADNPNLLEGLVGGAGVTSRKSDNPVEVV